MALPPRGRTQKTLLVFVLGISLLSSCRSRYKTKGEELAHTYCAACHVFPDPSLLDKKSWQLGVLPQMATRLGLQSPVGYQEPFRNPYMQALRTSISDSDFAQIVGYYRDNAPDTLPPQSLPAQPQLDPPFFAVGPFVPKLPSSGIITLLEADSVHRRIFVGEAGTNTLRVFDWSRRLLSTITLGSPPTALVVEGDRVLVLESGILDPNDEPKGSLVQYRSTGDSLHLDRVLIDSLFRPVHIQRLNLGGAETFVICEFGNNRGRLALYRYDGAHYQRQQLSGTPGAIRVEVRDMNGDGAPDLVVLFAQGDERLVLFENDGKGNFSQERILARFPPVYGSMYFTLRDFKGNGHPDIVYVNGDNFDFSRVLKPYHGVRILENDGKNNFHERYFYPLYGAAQAVVADFDGDGKPDILVASNFADAVRHPERGIVYLENLGNYQFQPYAFSASAPSQWNVMTAAELSGDGRLDVLVGAMDLKSVVNVQRRYSGQGPRPARDALLLFENHLPGKGRPGR
ncbi:MAG TPA: FG-GAP-like repeat-containing protein [Gemmatimonadaceae bacterium]